MTTTPPTLLRVLFLIPVMFGAGMVGVMGAMGCDAVRRGGCSAMWHFVILSALCHPERSEGSERDDGTHNLERSYGESG